MISKFQENYTVMYLSKNSGQRQARNQFGRKSSFIVAALVVVEAPLSIDYGEFNNEQLSLYLQLLIYCQCTASVIL
jgi:hypothetical protein